MSIERKAIQEPGHGLVVALAEEIGFADGLVGQGSVEAKVGGVKSVAAMRIAAMGGGTAKYDGPPAIG